MIEQSNPTGKISKKRDQRQRLIEAMLHEPGWEKAAASIGISKTTAWRIRKTPAFQTEYRQARLEVHQQSMARLQGASPSAAATLLKVMVGADSSPVNRLRAAELVCQVAKDGIELEDFAARLDRLEEVLKKEVNKCKRRC